MPDVPHQHPPAPADAAPGHHHPHEVAHAVATLRDQLGALERLIAGQEPSKDSVPLHRPGWMRPAAGEERWPVTGAIIVAIVLQLTLPGRLSIRPVWLLPSLEGALGVGLVIASPRRIDRRSTAVRAASVLLIALTSVANAWASVELIRGILGGTEGKSAGPLFADGASIYLTNIIVFALWYWDWDRGGPVARAFAERPYPDFLFPQMTQDHLAPSDWRPEFVDYLYLSYTNATAFSPTDVMPLARWAKLLMLVQSAIALATVGLVIARAVNILN